MAEQTFLNDGNVKVTRDRVTIGGTVYPVNGLTAIRTATEQPKRGASIVLGILGALVLLPGLSNGSGTALLIGAVLIGLAVLLWMRAKTTYHLLFGTAGGEKQALSSDNSEFIARVSNAINDALIARG